MVLSKQSNGAYEIEYCFIVGIFQSDYVTALTSKVVHRKQWPLNDAMTSCEEDSGNGNYCTNDSVQRGRRLGRGCRRIHPKKDVHVLTFGSARVLKKKQNTCSLDFIKEATDDPISNAATTSWLGTVGGYVEIKKQGEYAVLLKVTNRTKSQNMMFVRALRREFVVA